MNSLNIISARVTPQPTPAPSRSNSFRRGNLAVSAEDQQQDPLQGGVNTATANPTAEPDGYRPAQGHEPNDNMLDFVTSADEKSPLLGRAETPISKDPNVRAQSWHVVPARLANSLINAIRWLLSALVAPAFYLIACLYDQHGAFAPLRRLRAWLGLSCGETSRPATEDPEDAERNAEKRESPRRTTQQHSRAQHTSAAMRPPLSSGSSSSGLSSESDSDAASPSDAGNRATPSRHARSRSSPSSEEIAPARRSIRIKLHNDEALRQRQHKKSQSLSAKGSGGDGAAGDLSAQLKSPTSPVGAPYQVPENPSTAPAPDTSSPAFVHLLRESRPDAPEDADPGPGRNVDSQHVEGRPDRLGTHGRSAIKHNVCGGGRPAEPRASAPHPILRPQTAALRRVPAQGKPMLPGMVGHGGRAPVTDLSPWPQVSKWYNLVVFTASVQEYADPVIDWLESERKYFTGRFYRQHCTFRHGAFIKDLSSVEPDLSKVMILDNSPLSYMFHQGTSWPVLLTLRGLGDQLLIQRGADNAIPIQGWISDPTDNDLLHLVPLLEGLQYVSDVRALLALRGGEDGQHQVS